MMVNRGGVELNWEPTLDDKGHCPHGEYDWLDCGDCHRMRIAELEAALNSQITDTAIAEVSLEEAEAKNAKLRQLVANAADPALTQENAQLKAQVAALTEAVAPLLNPDVRVGDVWEFQKRWAALIQESK